MKNISVLGATGSIGLSTLDIARSNPSRIKIEALCAGRNYKKLAEQAIEFKPSYVAIADASFEAPLKDLLKGYDIKVESGPQSIIEAATCKKADMVIAAIVGAAGLEPVMAAIDSGKDIGLANKETLVVGGKIVMEAVKSKGVALLPVDSEHSAIFQCLPHHNKNKKVRKIIITASGGPFRTWDSNQLKDIRVEQALKHPNWDMGGKITIDSATLMNKGLEVIEARWLFGMDFEQIQVVVHPQSIVHSLVEFTDGSVLAQMGWPDMKLPIQYAISYPDRWGEALKPLDLVKAGSLTFEEPRINDFPCLDIAFKCGKKGGDRPCVMNAANEIAVEQFLQKKIGFQQIPEIISKTLKDVKFSEPDSIPALLKIDKKARELAYSHIDKS